MIEDGSPASAQGASATPRNPLFHMCSSDGQKILCRPATGPCKRAVSGPGRAVGAIPGGPHPLAVSGQADAHVGAVWEIAVTAWTDVPVQLIGEIVDDVFVIKSGASA